MPRSWQNNFENANLSVHNATIKEMRTYFDKQALKDPFIPKDNKNSNTSNNQRGNGSPTQRGNNNRNARNKKALPTQYLGTYLTGNLH